MKTPEKIFHVRLRALRLSSSLILKKYLYASFSFSYWKLSCTLFIFCCFRPPHVVLLTTQKSVEPRKNLIMPGQYMLLINWKWGHYREISDRGLDAEVWDFPVMTERTRLISYLLYGLFSDILKKNTIKAQGVNFHIRFRALRLSSSLILKKHLYASFFQLLKI